MTQTPPPGQPDNGHPPPTPRTTTPPPITEPESTAPPHPSSDTTAAHTPTAEPSAKRSRFGGLWVGLIIAAVVLVLLLIFILQNSQSVQVQYFGWSGHLPLAVAILLGVAAGALLVALPGSVRILQLRRTARRQ